MQDETVDMLVSAIRASFGERTHIVNLRSKFRVSTGHKLLSNDTLKFYLKVQGELVRLDDDGVIIPRSVGTLSRMENPDREMVLRHIHRIWGTYHTPDLFLRLGPIYPEDIGDAVSRFAAAALSIDRLLTI